MRIAAGHIAESGASVASFLVEIAARTDATTIFQFVTTCKLPQYEILSGASSGASPRAWCHRALQFPGCETTSVVHLETLVS